MSKIPVAPTPLTEEEARHIIENAKTPETVDDPDVVRIFTKETTADYKIEIWFGKSKSREQVVAKVDLWESGKGYAGDQDEHLFLCGYGDCHKPVHPDFVRGNWAVCPHCAKNHKNNGGVQVGSAVEAMGYRMDPKKSVLVQATQHSVITVNGKRYPALRDSILISCTPDILVEMLARYWEYLEGRVDFYAKFNPEDIRSRRALPFTEYDPKDEYVMYKMERLVKDLSTGASLTSRLKAFILA